MGLFDKLKFWKKKAPEPTENVPIVGPPEPEFPDILIAALEDRKSVV